ncbi:hypothetical protein Hsw_0678 [Hymenobacter swuensis DY53]|uniref:Uncharacterized protein n=2 Tax=Hymenobacter TaxID=89966 RepID=W8EUQ2_9BACT|nr:hypothetical protein Hsw_0678 [Hymenobacter swuensis DY53]
MLAVGANAASAQKLPLPGHKNPDWTLLKTEPLYSSPDAAPNQPQPVPMPNIDARGGMKDSSGQWIIYYDPLRNVRYNMADLKKNRLRVQDLRTGIVYTYAPKKGASPKPLH